MSSPEATAILAEFQEEALNGQVVLGGVAVPVVGVVRVTDLAVFPRKVTTGSDYTKDSDDLLSTHVISDLSGGSGIARINIASDVNRSWFSRATVRPNQTALPLLSRAVTGPNTTGPYPLGDLNDVCYVAWGTAGRIVAGSPAVASGAFTLSGVPTGKAVAFKGNGVKRLFIPLGGSGYDTYDGTTVVHTAASATTPAVQAFCLWDNRLAALATDGVLWFCDGTTWSTDGTGVDGTLLMRNLVSFLDKTGAPALHVITNRSVWAYDANTGTFLQTAFRMPPHPYGGLGSCVFDNRLHVSLGMGIRFYDLSVISPMGLDRDDGVPARFRGFILDLLEEDNAMYAVVSGQASTAVTVDAFTMDEGLADDALYFSAAQTVGSLWRWNGRGWVTVWESAGATGAPTWAVLSAAQGTYRLLWGYGGTLYYQDLPIGSENPRALIEAGIGAWAPDGRVELGDFDAGMTGFRKIASAFEVNAVAATNSESVSYQYSLDGGDTWMDLGVVNTAGQTIFPFGTGVLGPGAAGSEGLVFRKLRLAWDLGRDPADVTKTPVIEDAILHYVKVPKISRSWTFTVPCDGPYGDLSGQDLVDFLEGLTGTTDPETGIPSDPHFFTFEHRNRAYRAKVSQVGGGELTGADERQRGYQVNLVEVPVKQ